MPVKTVETYVEVDVDLDDFEDDDLIDEIEARGYSVAKVAEDDAQRQAIMDDAQRQAIMDDAAWRLSRGEVEEALLILSRSLGPQFRDLPDVVLRRRH